MPCTYCSLHIIATEHHADKIPLPSSAGNHERPRLTLVDYCISEHCLHRRPHPHPPWGRFRKLGPPHMGLPAHAPQRRSSLFHEYVLERFKCVGIRILLLGGVRIPAPAPPVTPPPTRPHRCNQCHHHILHRARCMRRDALPAPRRVAQMDQPLRWNDLCIHALVLDVRDRHHRGAATADHNPPGVPAERKTPYDRYDNSGVRDLSPLARQSCALRRHGIWRGMDIPHQPHCARWANAAIYRCWSDSIAHKHCRGASALPAPHGARHAVIPPAGECGYGITIGSEVTGTALLPRAPAGSSAVDESLVPVHPTHGSIERRLHAPRYDTGTAPPCTVATRSNSASLTDPPPARRLHDPLHMASGASARFSRPLALRRHDRHDSHRLRRVHSPRAQRSRRRRFPHRLAVQRRWPHLALGCCHQVYGAGRTSMAITPPLPLTVGDACGHGVPSLSLSGCVGRHHRHCFRHADTLRHGNGMAHSSAGGSWKPAVSAIFFARNRTHVRCEERHASRTFIEDIFPYLDR